jgi:hypothetical protein
MDAGDILYIFIRFCRKCRILESAIREFFKSVTHVVG